MDGGTLLNLNLLSVTDIAMRDVMSHKPAFQLALLAVHCTAVLKATAIGMGHRPQAARKVNTKCTKLICGEHYTQW